MSTRKGVPTGSGRMMPRLPLPAGATHIPGFLTTDEGAALVAALQAETFYRPVLRSGAAMKLEMRCYGRHWNAVTYRYVPTREDQDGSVVEPVPEAWAAIAAQAAKTAGFRDFAPDLLLVNRYTTGGKLGMHRDVDEEDMSEPVVSLSLGATSVFAFGGPVRTHPAVRVRLLSATRSCSADPRG